MTLWNSYAKESQYKELQLNSYCKTLLPISSTQLETLVSQNKLPVRQNAVQVPVVISSFGPGRPEQCNVVATKRPANIFKTVGIFSSLNAFGVVVDVFFFSSLSVSPLI